MRGYYYYEVRAMAILPMTAREIGSASADLPVRDTLVLVFGMGSLS
jgi:hypothetical protein